jgi:hypothetical protein
MRTRRRRNRNERRQIKGAVIMERYELAAIHGLLMIGRGYSLQVLAESEARGDEQQAARTRGHIEKTDQAIDLLERELVATQPKGSEP